MKRTNIFSLLLMLILSLDGCRLYGGAKQTNYDLGPDEQKQQKNAQVAVINPLPEVASQPIRASDAHDSKVNGAKILSRELHGVTLGETEESIKGKFKDLECGQAKEPYKRSCFVSFRENDARVGDVSVKAIGNVKSLHFILDNGGKIVRIQDLATSDIGDSKAYYSYASRIVDEYVHKYGEPKKLEKVGANYEKTNIYTWVDDSTALTVRVHKGNPFPEVPGGLAVMVSYDVILHDPSVIAFDPQYLKSLETTQ